MAIVFGNEKDRDAYIKREAYAVAGAKYPGRTKKEQDDRNWLAGMLVGFTMRMGDITSVNPRRCRMARTERSCA